MFDDAHDLYNLIPKLLNFGQNIILEIGERVHFLLRAGHADMALIDADALVDPFGFLMFPLIVVEFDVYAVEGIIVVLTGEVYPGGNAVFVVAVYQLNVHFKGGELGYFDWNFAGPQSEGVLA
jgi:hypothetical protein